MTNVFLITKNHQSVKCLWRNIFNIIRSFLKVYVYIFFSNEPLKCCTLNKLELEKLNEVSVFVSFDVQVIKVHEQDATEYLIKGREKRKSALGIKLLKTTAVRHLITMKVVHLEKLWRKCFTSFTDE